jgi:hypothetical protein
MNPNSGTLLAGGAAMGLFQGFLGSMAQAKRNEAIQDSIRKMQVQQGNQNVAFDTQSLMLQENQRFQTEGLMQNITTQRMALGRQYQQAAGMARAAIAESGFATSGSKRDILRSIDMDAVINRRILESNISRSLQQDAMEFRNQLFAFNQQRRAQQYGYQNQITSLKNEQGNTFLSGLTQGIQGFGTGISIGSAFSDRSISTYANGGRA